MATFIYVHLILVIFGLVVTIFWFLRLLASFSSLIFAAYATARGTWDVATGSTISFWRVLCHPRNRNSRNALLRNAMFLIGSFATTMGAVLLLVELNSKHCVLDFVQTASDGTVTSVCKTSE
ncbi:hypothetical protein [Tateyamaria omphalii]|uniref:hypothetical protein n=1 Tax=Tateyamaria omphalii TaxID=299262 RepID=UPI0012F75C86|nr:hypothetical protein [Tateyamaria omphalii]